MSKTRKSPALFISIILLLLISVTVLAQTNVLFSTGSDANGTFLGRNWTFQNVTTSNANYIWFEINQTKNITIGSSDKVFEIIVRNGLANDSSRYGAVVQANDTYCNQEGAWPATSGCKFNGTQSNRFLNVSNTYGNLKFNSSQGWGLVFVFNRTNAGQGGLGRYFDNRGAAGNGIAVRANNGDNKLETEFNGNLVSTTGSYIVENQIQCLGMTRNSTTDSTVQIFFNGTNVENISQQLIGVSTQPFTIGMRPDGLRQGNFTFYGMRVWNRTITTQEVQDSCNYFFIENSTIGGGAQINFTNYPENTSKVPIIFHVNDSGGTYNRSNITYLVFGTSLPPTPNASISINVTIPKTGQQVGFGASWNDIMGVSTWIFSTNSSGVWVNNSNGTFTISNQSLTNRTIIANPGTRVGYMFFANDSANNFNNTQIQTFVVDQLPLAFVSSKNTSVVKQNSLVLFNTTWQDDAGLSQYIFSTNQSGVWVNDSGRNFVNNQSLNTSNITAAKGTLVGWMFFVNDSNNQFNQTSIQTFRIDDLPLSFISVQNVSSPRLGDFVLFNTTWQDDNGLSQYIFSTNQSGIWINDSPRAFGSFNYSINITRITSTELIGWMFFANDSSNQWNQSALQTFRPGNPVINITGPATPYVTFIGSVTLSYQHFNLSAPTPIWCAIFSNGVVISNRTEGLGDNGTQTNVVYNVNDYGSYQWNVTCKDNITGNIYNSTTSSFTFSAGGGGAGGAAGGAASPPPPISPPPTQQPDLVVIEKPAGISVPGFDQRPLGSSITHFKIRLGADDITDDFTTDSAKECISSQGVKCQVLDAKSIRVQIPLTGDYFYKVYESSINLDGAVIPIKVYDFNFGWFLDKIGGRT